VKRLILIAFAVLLPIIGHCETRSSIRNDVRALMRDTRTDGYNRWSNALLDSRIDAGELEFIKLARQPIKTGFITTAVNVSTYALPSDCVVPIRIAYAIKPLTSTTTNYRRLEFVTVDGMDNVGKGNSFWEDTSADYPAKYMYPETGVLRIYPQPSSTYAGANFIKITYSVRVSTMATDSSVPFDGNTFMYTYHSAIKWYVCYLCALDTGLTNVADYYRNLFMADVNIAIGQTNDKPDKQGSFTAK